MADIELVLKLSEEDYTEICKCAYPNDILVGELVYQVRNNKPLHKGHERLTDANALVKRMDKHKFDFSKAICVDDSVKPYYEETLEGFIQYCKDRFGVELIPNKSDNPDTAEKLFGNVKQRIALDEHLLDLPPVYPKSDKPSGKWIPVSERFPEEDGGYLVTINDGYVHTALWLGNAEYWNRVTAWMPLPKPYKPQESEEE